MDFLPALLTPQFHAHFLLGIFAKVIASITTNIGFVFHTNKPAKIPSTIYKKRYRDATLFLIFIPLSDIRRDTSDYLSKNAEQEVSGWPFL
jgi:hypothetical protein